MRTRRKRPAVMWAPNNGHGADGANWIADTITVPAASGPAGTVTTMYSLIPDYPVDAVRASNPTAVTTMADYEGSGYRLRRIVGKFFAAIDQDVGTGVAPGQYPEAGLLTAGLIILRVDGISGAPLGVLTPNIYSPQALDNVQDPWIWRRTWVLGNDRSHGGAFTGISLFPSANTSEPSSVDGPHLDQKTARRVSSEERIQLVISCSSLENGLAADTNGTIRFVFDYRLLVSPLRIMGNRRNASR